jgi:hypothetical protein
VRGTPGLDTPADRKVAVDEVVRAGLVGHEVGLHAARPCALDHFGQQFRGVAEQADRNGLLLRRVVSEAGQRVVEVGRLFVEVARTQPEVDARLLTLDVQRASACESGGQRLRTAHAAETGGEDPSSRQAAAVVLATGLDESLVGTLHDALAADVDPRACGHLAIHHQALAIEFVEVLPGRPLRHQVRVGDQHPRCIRVGPEHPHRFA